MDSLEDALSSNFKTEVMKEKKVIVSVRFPLWILAGIDKFIGIWNFGSRSKLILFALAFFLENFTPENWELYWRAPRSKVKEAWDAFWSVIRSTGVENNTELCQEEKK